MKPPELIIRDPQRHLFREVAQRRFEDELFAYLVSEFPERVAPMGEAATRRTIRYGLSRVAPHELVKGRNVALYIVLMLYLGSDFDDDPLYPFVERCLSDHRALEDERMQALRAAALEFLRRAEGSRNQHLEAALQRIRSESLEELVGERVGGFVDWVIDRLERLQREKCEAVGATGLERLVEEGIAAARSLGLEGDRAVALFIGCRFMLGHRFYRDPQFPWAVELFADRDERASLKLYRLHRAALNHVEEQLRLRR